MDFLKPPSLTVNTVTWRSLLRNFHPTEKASEVRFETRRDLPSGANHRFEVSIKMLYGAIAFRAENKEGQSEMRNRRGGALTTDRRHKRLRRRRASAPDDRCDTRLHG